MAFAPVIAAFGRPPAGVLIRVARNEVDPDKPRWATVAVAAGLMKIGKRGALKRLRKLDAELDGRLLKAIGAKAMPKGTQASKYLVCLPVLREAMEPETEDRERELAELRAELSLVREKVEALRRAVKPLLAKQGASKT